RISAGAWGLGSQESMWLAPPYCMIKMQDLAEPWAVPELARRNSGKPSPSRPIPPTWSNRRRLNPREGITLGMGWLRLFRGRPSQVEHCAPSKRRLELPPPAGGDCVCFGVFAAGGVMPFHREVSLGIREVHLDSGASLGDVDQVLRPGVRQAILGG